jgi:hypothetical protein
MSGVAAQQEMQRWSGPGDADRALDVSDSWTDETVAKIIVRTLRNVEESGGQPPQEMQKAINTLKGAFALSGVPVTTVEAEAEQAAQHAAVRGLLAQMKTLTRK